MKATLCDGCSSAIRDDACEECGLCVKCEYCPDCRAVYAEFERDRDRLHEKIAKMWQGELQALRDAYAQRLVRQPDST